MSKKYVCMLMRINIDCNACCRKLRRIIMGMKAIEKHLIEKEHYWVSVCGRFTPADVAIKIRKKMNRRVQILEVEELETDAPSPEQQQQADPADETQGPSSAINESQNPMFPSLDNGNRRPMFPSIVNECRSFSASRPEFALPVTCFPESFSDMAESFWHYGFEFTKNRDCALSV